MNQSPKRGISYLIIGCMMLVGGYLIIQAKKFGSPVEGDTVYLTNRSALLLGGLMIVLSMLPLYEGIKSLLKSRRLK